MKVLLLLSAVCVVSINCESKFIVNGSNHEMQFFTEGQRSVMSSLISNSLLTALLTVNLTDACKEDVEFSIRSLRLGKLWALEMFDASAKLPSGVLNGNVNQYGDFDQCLRVKSNEKDLRGQYCLTSVQLSLPRGEKYLNMLRNLLMSYEPYKSDIDDMRAFLPKSSEFHWGSCVPSTCSNSEVSEAFKALLVDIFGIPDYFLKVKAKHRMCQVKDESWIANLEKKVIVAFGFLAFLFVVTILSTIYDSLEVESKNQWLTIFSIKKNFNQIMNTNSSSSDILSIHAVRAFNLIALLVSHKSMQLNFLPFTNRTDMNHYFLSSISIFFRSCYLFTDLFLMLSGVLLSYSLVGRLQRGQKINVAKEIFSRYFRFMPPLAALIFFVTLILPHVGSGPQWNMMIEYQSEICKKTWWNSFLMIHNWIGFENICSPNTHHVATDFQLFAVLVFFTTYIHKNPQKGSAALIILGILSTVARFYVVYSKELYIYITNGAKISRMYESSDLMYIITPYRFTVYAIGFLLGLSLRNYKNLKFSDRFINIGWTSAVICFFATVAMCIESQAYHTAVFASLAPITSCLFFAWIIFYAHLIHKQNEVNNRLVDILINVVEWKFLKIVTNLSYSVYLIQFAVFHYNIGVTRSASFYSNYESMFDLNEFLMITFAALAMAILIEYPFLNLKKILLDKRRVEQIYTVHDVNKNVIQKLNKTE